jgi:hypothetical protein
MSGAAGSASSPIATNILSSVIGFLILKQVHNRLYCRLAASIASLHILSQWFVLELLTLFDRIKRTDQLSMLRRLELALLSTIAVIGSYYVLINNSVGIFQLSKFFVVFFPRSLFRFTKVNLLARLLIVTGFAIFAFSDPDVNFFSAIVAIISSLSEGYHRSLSTFLCKEFNLSIGELHLSFIPHHYCMTIIVATLLDNTGERSFAYARLSPGVLVMVLLTCACSAVTFLSAPEGRALQLSENITAVLMLVLGHIFFPVEWESPSQMVRAMIGTGMAVMGAFTHLTATRDGSKKSDPLKVRENEL